jgi:hypothetical protein
LLENNIRREATQAGYGLALTEDEADMVVVPSVRGGWGLRGRTMLISFLTLTVYTPVHYPWRIDIHFYDHERQPIGDVFEKGTLTYHSWFIAIIPATLIQGWVLIPPAWRDLTETTARLTIGKLAGLSLKHEKHGDVR